MPTLTITTTSAQAARVSAAFGSYFRHPQDATNSEVKEHVIDYIRQIVLETERRDAANAAEAAVPDIVPT